MIESQDELETPPRPRWLRILGWSSAVVLALVVGFTVFVYAGSFPIELLDPDRDTSALIVDRHGKILREPVSPQREQRRRWVELEEVSPHLINALVAVEDQRFYSHFGVDPIAVVRAAWSNVRAGEIRSGASTLTMQVVRLVSPEPRTFAAKFRQAVGAMRLETELSKDEILTQYINRLPFGHQIEGVALASERFFGKPPSELSIAQAAFLAGLPQSPSGFDPYRRLDRALERQHEVLDRMHEEGFLTESQLRLAREEPIVIEPPTSNFLAPHFVDHVLRMVPDEVRDQAARVETTLDRRLQALSEGVVRAHVARLQDEDVSQAAVVLLDNESGEVLAMVGSVDFFDFDGGGQVNGALALRQPGSTLKPFTYAVALERGMTAADVLADVPTWYATPRGSYAPQNFDLRFHGPVRARVALASSLNVPAVKVLDRIGVGTLLERLRRLGFESLSEAPEHYGLGLTLGGGEVQLLELARAFRVLARGGLWGEVTMIRAARRVGGELLWQPEKGDERRVFEADIANLVTDMLSDRQARALGFGLHGPLDLPFDVAVKTGTSSDFRDIWTVGYTTQHTLAVWVGNFDARPMGDVSGVSGAGPIFRDIMLGLYAEGDPEPFDAAMPEGWASVEICALSGALPAEHCPHRVAERFREATRPIHTCPVHRVLRVDPVNGLLAGPACEDAEMRPYAILGPEYDTWQRETGAISAPTEASPRCPEGALEQRTDEGGALLRIVRPVHGAHLLFDPDIPPESQALTLESVSQGVDRVEWRVDGRLLSEPRWLVERGQHRIEASGWRGEERVVTRALDVMVE